MEVVRESGADIVRLWVLSSDYTSDVHVSKGIFKQVQEVYRKIRNTARYILGNIYDLDVNNIVAYNDLEEIDKWALMKLNKLIRECTTAYDNYEFNKAYKAINNFCVVEMSNFYLDIIKDRLYTYKKESKERRSAQTAMYKILDAIVKMLAPMASFTAEEIWKYMIHTKKESVESVMLSDWPEVDEKYDDKELEEKWNKIIELKTDVAKALEEARANKVIGHSLNAKVTLYVNEDNKNYYKLISENKDLLQTVFIVSGLEIEDNKRKSEGNKVGIEVKVADGEKCERCWMYSTTVGEDKENPTICHRCSEHLK
jgi:isoleucyl-tRNA synthetase